MALLVLTLKNFCLELRMESWYLSCMQWSLIKLCSTVKSRQIYRNCLYFCLHQNMLMKPSLLTKVITIHRNRGFFSSDISAHELSSFQDSCHKQNWMESWETNPISPKGNTEPHHWIWFSLQSESCKQSSLWTEVTFVFHVFFWLEKYCLFVLTSRSLEIQAELITKSTSPWLSLGFIHRILA